MAFIFHGIPKRRSFRVPAGWLAAPAESVAGETIASHCNVSGHEQGIRQGRIQTLSAVCGTAVCGNVGGTVHATISTARSCFLEIRDVISITIPKDEIAM